MKRKAKHRELQENNCPLDFLDDLLERKKQRMWLKEGEIRRKTMRKRDDRQLKSNYVSMPSTLATEADN